MTPHTMGRGRSRARIVWRLGALGHRRPERLNDAPDDETEHDGANKVDADTAAVQLAGVLHHSPACTEEVTLDGAADWATAALLAVIMDRAARAANFFENILTPLDSGFPRRQSRTIGP